jgi:hypothetical protein
VGAHQAQRDGGVRQLTPRNWGSSLDSCIAQINAWVRGWHGFFGIASESEMQMMRKIDAHIRRRLRAIILRHWKRKRTIVRRLIKLGVRWESACRQIYEGRKSWWALSHTPVVDYGLRNAYFAKRGLVFLVDLHQPAHQHIVVPELPQLALWDDSRSINRPAAGVITRRPEEPYTTSVRTVLWEPGRVTAPATRGSGRAELLNPCATPTSGPDSPTIMPGEPQSGGGLHRVSPSLIAEQWDEMLRLATRPTGSPPACWSAAFGPAARTKVADALLDYGAGLVKTEFIVLPHRALRPAQHPPPAQQGREHQRARNAVFCGNEGKTMRPRRDARRCKLGEVFDGGRCG